METREMNAKEYDTLFETRRGIKEQMDRMQKLIGRTYMKNYRQIYAIFIGLEKYHGELNAIISTVKQVPHNSRYFWENK